jgi:hypothetical protein
MPRRTVEVIARYSRRGLRLAQERSSRIMAHFVAIAVRTAEWRGEKEEERKKGSAPALGTPTFPSTVTKVVGNLGMHKLYKSVPHYII